MERGRAWVWFRRSVVGLLVLGLIVAVGVTWRFMDIVDAELLSMAAADRGATTVSEVGGGRIVLDAGERPERRGVWGIAGPNGYGQVTGVISIVGERVERGFLLLSGAIAAGDTVTFDVDAFFGDPRTAHGLPFEEVRVPGALGVNPAWLIDGEAETWVVFVHGRGPADRAESLRSLPTFRKLGLPILVITYRTDHAAEGGTARSMWGLDEWRDLETALETASLRGADDFVLVGHDLGASIVATFLHESDSIPRVRGVVFDSPVLDIEARADRLAAQRGIPTPLAEIGKALSRIRFGLEWSRIDQLGRVAEFDPAIAMLVLHGTGDSVAPISAVEEFVAALPGTEFERFEGAAHGALWNSESVRYDEVLTDFLFAAVPELSQEG